MNQQYSQSMFMCSGSVIQAVEGGTSNYEVQIYKSPIGEFNGPIYCTSIYSTNSSNKYKKSDIVKVLIMFVQGGPDGGVQGLAPGTEAYIMGKFDEERLVNGEVENPLLPNQEDGVNFTNPVSKAGVNVSDDGVVTTSTSGNVFNQLKPKGYGRNKDSSTTKAQNHHLSLSGLNEFDTAVEHFGVNTGISDQDATTRITADQREVSRRRFIPQNANLENWVSSCEGTFSPLMGPNNKTSEIKGTRDTLLYKVINKGKKRITIDGGDTSDNFLSLRVDDVIVGEKALPANPGVATAILGNRFKFDIGDDGSFKILGAGEGTSGVSKHKMSIECTSDGELKIKAAKGITMTTGDSDEEVNSINISGSNIDIKSSGSLTHNGKPLLNDDALGIFSVDTLSTMFSPNGGGPIVPNPAFLAQLLKMAKTPSKAGGITSSGVTTPVAGIILNDDKFTTV